MSTFGRLEALESMLREAADEISLTRRGLAAPSGEHWSGELERGAGGEGIGSREDPSASRSEPTGRARLRESPLGDLFRSTLPSVQGGGSPSAFSNAVSAPDTLRATRYEPIPSVESGPPVETDPESPAAASLRNEADTAPWLDDRTARVEPRRARMLDNSESLLGPEHPDTLWAAHDLAYALLKAGDAAAALRLAARLVRVRTRLLGPHHAHTLRARELQARAGEHRSGPSLL